MFIVPRMHSFWQMSVLLREYENRKDSCIGDSSVMAVVFCRHSFSHSVGSSDVTHLCWNKSKLLDWLLGEKLDRAGIAAYAPGLFDGNTFWSPLRVEEHPCFSNSRGKHLFFSSLCPFCSLSGFAVRPWYTFLTSAFPPFSTSAEVQISRYKTGNKSPSGTHEFLVIHQFRQNIRHSGE